MPRFAFALLLTSLATSSWAAEAVLRGRVVDADSGEPLAARIYLQDGDGKWFHVEAAENGTAIPYEKGRNRKSVEVHTTLSAHPFLAKIPPGEYTLLIEKGKEYLPHEQQLTVSEATRPLTIRLQRWIDMAAENWYSGETHVHRAADELPTLIVAEDLNVAFPLTYWVTQAYAPPRSGEGKSTLEDGRLIEVDSTHVIYPRNTEYEIFSVDGKRHTLGAIFALNHRTVFERGVPPVTPIAEQVHREGGLLELDKHNWPWSMMLVPVMKVDLYELTNNHIWRAPFYFGNFGEAAAPYMTIEQDANGFTEQGWIDFTWQNYYCLLNCGFALRPTGGTASGVHPVPLGFGRVYVKLPDGFSYESWVDGLSQGRSFVTTGPLLSVTIDGQLPGSMDRRSPPATRQVRVRGWSRSLFPLKRLEIVGNGEILARLPAQNRQLDNGGFETILDHTLKLDGPAWLIVRCVSETPAGRPRFAHTAPFYFLVKGQEIRPRREEVQYLITRIENELQRHRGVLNDDALQEYEQALSAYRRLLPQ